MRGWWGVLMGCALALGCATGRGGPPYSATDEPPPRGMPQPRLGHIPPPPPNPGADSDEGGFEDQRFLVLQGQERKEQAQRQAAQPTGVAVEVGGPGGGLVCEELRPEETLDCPLHDPAAVRSIAEIPGGVRVTLRPGSVAPERLRRQLECQKSLAVARPKVPASCAFLDAQTEARVVVDDGGGVAVELERGKDVDQLRQQVRTALARD